MSAILMLEAIRRAKITAAPWRHFITTADTPIEKPGMTWSLLDGGLVAHHLGPQPARCSEPRAFFYRAVPLRFSFPLDQFSNIGVGDPSTR